MLAGVSVDYYIRLERGDASGASDEVLDGIARALQLDEDERTHLLDLIRHADAPIPRQETVRHAVRRIVDAMTGMPAMVRSPRLDVLYANQLGYALYSAAFDNPVRPANPARFVFLEPASREFFESWEHAADDMVALLRAESGRNPADRRLVDLLDELSAGSEEFRSRWDMHDVLLHRSGTARIHHPIAGSMNLGFEDLVLPDDLGQTILVFTSEPDPESEAALERLADWAGSREQARLDDFGDEVVAESSS